MFRACIIAVLLSLTLPGCAVIEPRSPMLVTEEFKVQSPAPGIELYVRNKHPAATVAYPSNRIALFIHGATFPSESTFDLTLGGVSWMDYIAEAGYDVYLVDVRGFGRSTHPQQMSEPAASHPPLLSAADASDDIGAVVNFIRERRGASKIDLIGWSWGSLVAALYTASHPDTVDKLVLYGPAWVNPGRSAAAGGPAVAYRRVDVAETRTRWLQGVPAAKQTSLIPPGWFEQWVAANVATDPDAANTGAGVIRVPNRRPAGGPEPFDPANIRTPTFLVNAEWDYETPAAMAQALFERLVNTPYKQYLEIGEGTHSIMLERNRLQLFRAVQHFLDEAIELRP
jgi:pimeloyl-ACP methyl ester carboxylesterase